jgi:hypothetical protein
VKQRIIITAQASSLGGFFFHLAYHFSPPVSSSDRSLASRQQNLLSATRDSRHESFVAALMRGAVPGEKKDGGGKIVFRAKESLFLVV